METRAMTTSDDEKVQTDMEMNSAEEHHVIEILEVMNKDILCSMNNKIREQQPKLLRTSAGGSSCCVFRVPQSFINSSGPNVYRPDIVSIGPYHRCKSHDSHEEHKSHDSHEEHKSHDLLLQMFEQHKSHELQLQMFEEHKWRYLHSLVTRTMRAKSVGLADYVKAIRSRESEARDCYSETIDLNTKEFVEMMVLDGCFVIELFRKAGGLVRIGEDDPIFRMSWVHPCLVRDLLKLENQIPLFVLQSLFDLSKIPGKETDASFAMLALKYFSRSIPMPEKAHERYINDVSSYDRPKHLLDFIRARFIPDQEPPKNDNSKIGMIPYVRLIPCATKLRRAGINCKPHSEDSKSMIHYYVKELRRAVIRCISNPRDSPPKNNSFLDIKFRRHAPHGVIELPSIRIDDVTTAFLLNCVAYEQCHWTPSKDAYFTTYATFMDCLINTREDVGLLCDNDVIENYLGHDKEVAKFLNKFGKDVAVNMNKCYLSEVFNDVNEYYKNNWHVYWATFRHKYFGSPWSFISLGAAVLLLLLTFAQTLFPAYDYYQRRKG